ncbi:MAG: YicC/YloC family endoribonuclease [Planctomycetota bacterium]
MTGHGQANAQTDHYRIVAEIRSVNNRFLKTTIHCELDTEHLSKIETLVKNRIHRGSVNVRIKTSKNADQPVYRLNDRAIQAYWTQLAEIAGGSQGVNVEAILQLPGVIDDEMDESATRELWPKVELAVNQALANLNHMRMQEGQVMETNMLANCDQIQQSLEKIKALAPQAMDNYSTRMKDRINKLLSEFDITVEPKEIIKEVGIFAEKCDISEEVVRLGSHIGQFRNVAEKEANAGKKLDFLVQEMLRETNTIGSKANHVEISNQVVEIKTAIERIREMVQNVE